MVKNSLWVESYRSNNLSEYVGNEQIKNIIGECILKNDIPNLLLYGTPGTGKTTLAKLIASNLECDSLYINASNERGVDTIRDKVQSFATAASFQPIKIVILDEADYITSIGQAALRNIIEENSSLTRFILTGNYLERIIDPIQSRCQALKIIPPSKSTVAELVSSILENEKIKFELDDLVIVINKFYPDIRKILNTCQLFSKIDQTLKIDNKQLLSSSLYIDLIFLELKEPKKSSWKTIRQIILDNDVSDFEELYKILYERLEEYAKGNEGSIIIILEEYLYHAQFRIDKEINFCACLVKIIDIISKKKVI